MTMTERRQDLVSSLCTECGAPVEFELGAQQVRCEHCEAGLAVDRGQRLIRLSCPACSGNFYSLDGSLTGRCPFCGASLLALARDRVLQFLFRPSPLVPEETEGSTLVFLPFWHLSGLVFAWDMGTQITIEQDIVSESAGPDGAQVRVPSGIRRESGPQKAFRGRVIDMAMPDPATQAFGVGSLRWRSAIFPMEPVVEAHESLGRIIRPTLDVATVRTALTDRAMSLDNASEDLNRLDCQRQDLLTEEMALFYYPFWARRDPDGNLRVWDGITGDLEVHGPGTAPPMAGPATVFDDLTVIELRCQSCGDELVPGNRAAVVPCQSCSTFYRVTRDGLAKFEARHAEPQIEVKTGRPVWLPFYKVPAEVRFRGRRATRVMDIVNQLGVMRGVTKTTTEMPASPLHYYVSAYGSLRAPRVDHAARDMSRLQPMFEAGPGGEGDWYHCFFDVEDAKDMAYATWIQLLPSAVGHQIQSLRITVGEPQLWYVPFESRGRELINLVTGAAYDRSTFRGVSH
jgi:DNA-directed RNA polymerase subunit RPC12/RpoP